MDINEYRKRYVTTSVNIIAKTGCPYNCTYCDAKTVNGDKFIFRNPEAIVDDAKKINQNNGPKTFFLLDPTFNSPLGWAKEVLREIVNAKHIMRFMAILNPIRNCYDDEFFMLFKRAGGFFAMVGYESFSQKMLESYKKPFNISDVYNFSECAAKHGLTVGTELLFGGPGENAETIKESMDFLKKMNYALLIYGIGIRILPNTGIFEIAEKEGMIKSADELLFPKFYVSKEVDINWAFKYLKTNTGKYWYRNIKLLPFLMKNLCGKFFNIRY